MIAAFDPTDAIVSKLRLT